MNFGAIDQPAYLQGNAFNKPAGRGSGNKKDETPKEFVLHNVTYRITRRLGGGAFGDIHMASFNTPQSNGSTRTDYVAVKVERHDQPFPLLKHEYKIYELLTNAPGIPKCYGYLQLEHCDVLVEELCGKSLSEVMSDMQGHFSLKTTIRVAGYVISHMEEMHKRGVVHRDVKPANFVLGREGQERPIYCVDLGLAKSFLNDGGNHFSLKENARKKDLVGTAEYASLNNHEGVELSRRDDLEAVGYMLIHFLRGTLPWLNAYGADTKEKNMAIHKSKLQSYASASLFDRLPVEFKVYMEYCRGLAYAEKPDYDYLRKLFAGLYTRYRLDKGGEQYEFDWQKESAARYEGLREAGREENPRAYEHAALAQLPAERNTREQTMELEKMLEACMKDHLADNTKREKRLAASLSFTAANEAAGGTEKSGKGLNRVKTFIRLASGMGSNRQEAVSLNSLDEDEDETIKESGGGSGDGKRGGKNNSRRAAGGGSRPPLVERARSADSKGSGRGGGGGGGGSKARDSKMEKDNVNGPVVVGCFECLKNRLRNMVYPTGTTAITTTIRHSGSKVHVAEREKGTIAKGGQEGGGGGEGGDAGGGGGTDITKGGAEKGKVPVNACKTPDLSGGGDTFGSALEVEERRSSDGKKVKHESNESGGGGDDGGSHKKKKDKGRGDDVSSTGQCSNKKECYDAGGQGDGGGGGGRVGNEDKGETGGGGVGGGGCGENPFLSPRDEGVQRHQLQHYLGQPRLIEEHRNQQQQQQPQQQHQQQQVQVQKQEQEPPLSQTKEVQQNFHEHHHLHEPGRRDHHDLLPVNGVIRKSRTKPGSSIHSNDGQPDGERESRHHSDGQPDGERGRRHRSDGQPVGERGKRHHSDGQPDGERGRRLHSDGRPDGERERRHCSDGQPDGERERRQHCDGQPDGERGRSQHCGEYHHQCHHSASDRPRTASDSTKDSGDGGGCGGGDGAHLPTKHKGSGHNEPARQSLGINGLDGSTHQSDFAVALAKAQEEVRLKELLPATTRTRRKSLSPTAALVMAPTLLTNIREGTSKRGSSSSSLDKSSASIREFADGARGGAGEGQEKGRQENDLMKNEEHTNNMGTVMTTPTPIILTISNATTTTITTTTSTNRNGIRVPERRSLDSALQRASSSSVTRAHAYRGARASTTATTTAATANACHHDVIAASTPALSAAAAADISSLSSSLQGSSSTAGTDFFSGLFKRGDKPTRPQQPRQSVVELQLELERCRLDLVADIEQMEVDAAMEGNSGSHVGRTDTCRGDGSGGGRRSRPLTKHAENGAGGGGDSKGIGGSGSGSGKKNRDRVRKSGGGDDGIGDSGSGSGSGNGDGLGGSSRGKRSKARLRKSDVGSGDGGGDGGDGIGGSGSGGEKRGEKDKVKVRKSDVGSGGGSRTGVGEGSSIKDAKRVRRSHPSSGGGGDDEGKIWLEHSGTNVGSGGGGDGGADPVIVSEVGIRADSSGEGESGDREKTGQLSSDVGG